MAKLLILADDFTGAMDTGVQFARLGIKTLVGKDAAALIASAGEATVLVIDTNTRHLKPDLARDIVFRAAGLGRAAGIPFLYKKTDSALRGNVGAELTSALCASQAGCLPFVPAYPQMGRTTKNGIHYIGDVPVSQSDFGRDPFSPVLASNVVSLLALQSSVPVVMAGEMEPDAPFIKVYNAQTDDDLTAIAQSLQADGRLQVCAGCAGFASVLPGVMGLSGGPVESVRSRGNLLVLCGSVHPVAKAQIRFAVEHGTRHIRLTPHQKLGLNLPDSPEHQALIARIATLCREDAPVIVDSSDEDGETALYAASLGLTLADIRVAISATMGRLGRDLLLAKVDSTMLFTGGDTLCGFLDAWGPGSLRPLCELAPGIVRAVFESGGIRHDMITKSGGFGEKHLLWQLAGQMKNEKEE